MKTITATTIEVGTPTWGRIPLEQRAELTNWVRQQAGHDLRGITRVQIRNRLFRALTIRVDGIVKARVDGQQQYTVLNPLRPREVLRYSGVFKVRTPLPAWWRA